MLFRELCVGIRYDTRQDGIDAWIWIKRKLEVERKTEGRNESERMKGGWRGMGELGNVF